MPPKRTLCRQRKFSKKSVVMKRLWKRRQPIEQFLQQEADVNDMMAVHDYCINPEMSSAELPITCDPTNEEIQSSEKDTNVNDFMVDHDYCTDPSRSSIQQVAVDPWDPNNEYDSIQSHQLYVEKEKEIEVFSLKGNRIVNIQYFLTETLKVQYNHSRHCTFGLLKPSYEKLHGLSSVITLKCSTCEKLFAVNTEKPRNTLELWSKSVINTAFVWGTLSSGLTFTSTQDIMASLDIPPMSYSSFNQIDNLLGDRWKDVLCACMYKAGQEELKIAVENHQVTEDGVPWIAVHCDGGWSKRSYGHSYNALSGTAVVIGKETGKVLFIGIRNKYCCICTRAANQRVSASNHRCFRNWSGSSTGMEADIIVEAFKSSIEMHGLKYLKIIADGDSSIYNKIQKEVSYGKDVEKIECVNHVVKNYGKQLYKIKTNINIPAVTRKLLTSDKIKKLQNFVTQSSKLNNDVETMKYDISNSIYHVYGNHSNCNERYCSVVGHQDNVLCQKFEASGLIHYFKDAQDFLMKKVHKIVSYENNNKVEMFMSLLSKMNAGKRLNLIQRRSFEVRSYLAALRYNEGLLWQVQAYEDATTSDVGEYFSKLIRRSALKKQLKQKRRYKHKGSCSMDKDYGSEANQALLNPEEFKSECKRILQSNQVAESQQWQIASATVGQFDNHIFKIERRRRLTVSNFGSAVKRQRSACKPLLRRILHSKGISTPAIEYGKNFEASARLKFENEMGLLVHLTGLFVDTTYGFLGASPDGLVGDNALIEIKCAYSLNKNRQSIDDAIQSNKNFYLKYNEFGQPTLKQNHNYFYQVQGLLNITKRELCYFVVYINEKEPLFVEKIVKNECLWQEIMLPKLKKFYMGCYLPELIQRYIERGVDCPHEEVSV